MKEINVFEMLSGLKVGERAFCTQGEYISCIKTSNGFDFTNEEGVHVNPSINSSKLLNSYWAIVKSEVTPFKAFKIIASGGKVLRLREGSRSIIIDGNTTFFEFYAGCEDEDMLLLRDREMTARWFSLD